MVWMRAVPSTWRTAGMRSALSGSTSKTKSMKGETPAWSNQLPASSSNTTGATGRKSSRSLMSFRRASSRLHPDMLKWPPATQSGVHHAVQRHAASHAQVVGPGCPVQPAREFQDGLFKYQLQGVCDIVVTLLQWATFSARWAEAFLETERLYCILAVCPDLDELTKIGDITRFAKGSQCHDFVLV